MLAPTVTRRLIAAFVGADPTRADAARRRLADLTPRERDVITAVSEGLSNTEIGWQLRLREATMKTHVSRALAKLGLNNRVQAAILVRDAQG
jgi:DNA-binding NarL/FixJ family response regulator